MPLFALWPITVTDGKFHLTRGFYEQNKIALQLLHEFKAMWLKFLEADEDMMKLGIYDNLAK